MQDGVERRGLVQLVGTVEHVIYTNEQNGYTICDLSVGDEEIYTVVGIMPMVADGDRLTVWGKWVHNARYGRQFSVSQYERIMPADTASILRYLSSRTIKGVGPKTAQRIVEEFGEDTFEVIEKHPEWLANVKGISQKLAQSISENFREQSEVRSTMMFFQEYFGVATILKIYKRFGGRAVEIAKQNPYRLCNEVEGIGFESADEMAEKLGFKNNNFDRIMSGVDYVLTKASISAGHVCFPRGELESSAVSLLEVSREEISAGIDELLRTEKLVKREQDGVELIYQRSSFDDERYIARKLRVIDRMCAAVNVCDVDRFIVGEEQTSGIQYASLQKKAIADALRYGVMVLTGGPGTGKTTIVRALIHIFDSMGLDIALAAPTGRAAKRLSEATSTEAKTIHRLLEMSFDAGGRHVFLRDQNNLLDEQIIIIDEASMIDNMLMAALLRAVKPGARLIIIGDIDQLPSVGAGNVLRDIIDSGAFATVRLTEIFRQAEQSLIITNAHSVNRGEMPTLDAKDNDFFFLSREYDRDIAATVCDLCINRLPRAYGDLARFGIQVVTPSKKGEAGTENLNAILQARLNPSDKSKKEHGFRDRVYREGDKVMQIRNNYDLMWSREGADTEGSGIFNGDIGTILHINVSESYMEIRFDDRLVRYEFSLLEDLEHAYAITVHKSQGSEYPIIVLPLGSASPMLHTRNLLYTAITRAQNMVVMVGRESVVAEMVNNDRQAMRYTGLVGALQSELGDGDGR